MTLPFQIVRFYRSWKKFANTIEGWEAATWVLVDDLCETKTPELNFSSDKDVLRELDELLARCKSSTELGQYRDPTIRKLEASRVYLLGKDDPNVTIADVKRYKISERPEEEDSFEILKSEVETLQEKAKSHLSAKGVDLKTFNETAMDARAAARFLGKAGNVWLSKMREEFPFLSEPDYECKEVSLEGPFQNVVTFEGRFQLLINSMAERFFTPVHLNFLALHEICGHIQHFTQLKQSKLLQTQAPHLLCIAIHTPEAVWVEGIAQVIALYLARQHAEEAPEMLAQVEKMNLMLAVRHSNMLGLITQKLDVPEAAKKHVQFLGGSIEDATGIYNIRLKSRFAALNALGYHAGLKHYRSFLNSPQKDRSHLLCNLLEEYPA